MNHMEKNSKWENIYIKKPDKWGPKLKKKLMFYQLELEGKIKNNKTFIKELRKKKKPWRIKIKLKTSTHFFR
jgi:hypothetical protein